MIKRCASLLLLLPFFAFGQNQSDSTATDTLSFEYEPVIISAFEQNNDELKVAGGISTIDGRDLTFGNQGSISQSPQSNSRCKDGRAWCGWK